MSITATAPRVLVVGGSPRAGDSYALALADSVVDGLRRRAPRRRGRPARRVHRHRAVRRAPDRGEDGRHRRRAGAERGHGRVGRRRRRLGAPRGRRSRRDRGADLEPRPPLGAQALHRHRDAARPGVRLRPGRGLPRPARRPARRRRPHERRVVARRGRRRSAPTTPRPTCAAGWSSSASTTSARSGCTRRTPRRISRSASSGRTRRPARRPRPRRRDRRPLAVAAGGQPREGERHRRTPRPGVPPHRAHRARRERGDHGRQGDRRRGVGIERAARGGGALGRRHRQPGVPADEPAALRPRARRRAPLRLRAGALPVGVRRRHRHLRRGRRVLAVPGARGDPVRGRGPNFRIAYAVLAVAIVAEGISLVRAYRQTSGEARGRGISLHVHLRASRDPTTKTVLFEDTAAVTGNVVAIAGVALHQITGRRRYEGVAALIVAAHARDRRVPPRPRRQLAARRPRRHAGGARDDPRGAAGAAGGRATCSSS